ncbi:GGDEF domain-containing protein [Psychromonas sp. RZ22]|uniref:GGDEF domain-containing protein n=1 Tax=Psychromonas algarum TaxID=2555643 RepID=UPI0010672E43|nr:GGDEF domain-containing protein [Psychromonas sp. RZ22]TEW56114.1 GGDEF domain-containing protein [Psychromonas sp. RZ22]
MAQLNQSDEIDKNDTTQEQDGKGVVHLSKHQEEKQSSESSAFEQVMQQMNIADRKSFDKKYTQLWNEASDENELLTLMICEIDFFKAYVDNYGHQGASFMLLVIALALKTTCEEHDCYLGRYRGDEFGILIKGGDIETANEIAEKLRFAVEKSRTEHKFSSVSNIVTLSIGVSSFYPTSMQVVMKQASRALTNAKLAGRNQVSGHLDTTLESSSSISNSQQEAELANELLQQEALKKEEALRKEEELKKAEALRLEELKKEKEKQKQLRLEEEERLEEEKKKQAVGMYDMDPFF